MPSPSSTSPELIRARPAIPDGRLPAGVRRRNIPWVVLGVLIVAGSGLAFTVWAQRLDERQPALALATDVRAGEIVSGERLTTIHIGSDVDLGFVDPSDAARIVGRVAKVDLPEGTLAVESLFADEGLLRPGQAIVGVPVGRAELPITGLRPGDEVLVVEIPPDSAAPGTSEAGARVWAAQVFSTENILDDAGETTVVSLEVDAPSAPAVAAATARGVRLVLVSDTGGAEEVADDGGATPSSTNGSPTDREGGRPEE